MRSVAREVIARCRIVGGIAILENAYDETAEIVGVATENIESVEAELLSRVRLMMPRLPFDHAELLIVDQIVRTLAVPGWIPTSSVENRMTARRSATKPED